MLLSLLQDKGLQAIKPAVAAPSVASSSLPKRFSWSYAFLAVRFLAFSGVGTIIVFKVSSIDIVLLSHPDLMHLGALPYAMKQLEFSALDMQ